MTVPPETLAERPRQEHGPELAGHARHGVRLSLAIFGASSLVTLVVALAVAAVSDRSVTKVLTRWDGGWYLGIVQHGYPEAVLHGFGAQAQSTLGFFPGYPLLIGAGSSLMGLSPALVGVMVSTLAGAATSVVLWLPAARIADVKTANRTVVLFCFFPPRSCCAWCTPRRCCCCWRGCVCSHSSGNAERSRAPPPAWPAWSGRTLWCWRCAVDGRPRRPAGADALGGR